MKFARIVHWVGIVVIASILGCTSDQGCRPTQTPGLYTLRGHLRMTGYLVDALGNLAGTRVLGDADGVQVELLHGPRVVATTTTVKGVYSFSGLPSGGYVARSRVIGDIGDETTVLTVANSNLAAADTLRLESQGDLFPVPNPVVGATLVYFALPDTEEIDVEIMNVAGDTVRTLLAAERPQGLNQLRWDGLDRYGHAVPPALYWVTFAAGSDVRAQLLFKVNPGPSAADRVVSPPP